jgi:hypothetical protein
MKPSTDFVLRDNFCFHELLFDVPGKFRTWPGGGSWMVGRNPCRPIRAVADVSYERGMEMAVQEHADHLLILVHGLNARLACMSSIGNYAIWLFL